MSSSEPQSIDFYRGRRPLWPWWLAIFGLVFAVLVIGYSHELRVQTVPQLLDLAHVRYDFFQGQWVTRLYPRRTRRYRRTVYLDDLLGRVFFEFWRWSAGAKALLIAAAAASALSWLLRDTMGLMEPSPFLSLNGASLEGDTPLGRQEVFWHDVQSVVHRRRKTLFGVREQLIISTHVLAMPTGFMAELKYGNEVAPVTFATPPGDFARIEEIKSYIRHFAPEIEIIEE